MARYGDTVRARWPLSVPQLKVLERLSVCRTAALDGHLDVCDHGCGFERPSYNSCRDRHCPKCQSTRQAQWVAMRGARMLPVPHYHVVFTLPGRLRPLARADRAGIFNDLFRAAAQTLEAFASDDRWMGAQLGVTAILHTWTRKLTFHPHVHCVVTSGGLSRDGTRWVPSRRRRFLFPVRALAKVFRAKLLERIKRRWRRGELKFSRRTANLRDPRRFERLMDGLYRQRWVVYAKRPFGGAGHLFSYLGRYTHRVGISNQRLVGLTEEGVRFVTKKGQTETLAPAVFVRRFLDHVLPPRFVKIRHYGLYASANVETRLKQARALVPIPRPAPTDGIRQNWSPADIKALDARELLFLLTGVDVNRCPRCKVGTLIQLPLPGRPSHVSRGPP